MIWSLCVKTPRSLKFLGHCVIWTKVNSQYQWSECYWPSIAGNLVVFFPSVIIQCLWFIENSSELWTGIPRFHFIMGGWFLG